MSRLADLLDPEASARDNVEESVASFDDWEEGDGDERWRGSGVFRRRS